MSRRSFAINNSYPDFSKEVGAQGEPFGCWDPLNFVYNVNQERFDHLRNVEIKHGRIAMLAIIGHMVTTAGVRIPGCEYYPTGIKALSVIPNEALLTNFAIAGFIDYYTTRNSYIYSEFPGDLRNGMYQNEWNTFTPQEQIQKRTIELNNGRAAQMGILALMFHEMLDNEPYMINAFLGYPSHFNEGF